MKRLFAVALGILTAIGGFLDIGDIVTNAVVGSRFGMSLAWVVVVGVIGIWWPEVFGNGFEAVNQTLREQLPLTLLLALLPMKILASSLSFGSGAASAISRIWNSIVSSLVPRSRRDASRAASADRDSLQALAASAVPRRSVCAREKASRSSSGASGSTSSRSEFCP